jgi:hypothetical protein
VRLSRLLPFNRRAESASEQEGKDVPDTASCFKIADRFRIRFAVEIHIRVILGDSK